MKRADRNKSKSQSHDGHSDAHQNEADNYERHVDGSINVRGEVEVKLPPGFPEKCSTKSTKDNRDRKRFVVEILTLIVLAIYAALTAWQACLTRDIAKIAQKQLALARRPVVGLADSLDAFSASDIRFNPNGDAFADYVISAKNYSNNPAQNIGSFAVLLVTDEINTIHEFQKTTCGEHVVGNRDMGMILFPGKLKAFSTSQSLFQRTKMISKVGDGSFQAWFVGCVGYRDGAGEFYYTGFVYRLTQPGLYPRAVRIPPSMRDPVHGEWTAYVGASIQ